MRPTLEGLGLEKAEIDAIVGEALANLRAWQTEGNAEGAPRTAAKEPTE
jgi:hypothetical protein